jgi:hypothetical protein
MRLSTIERSKRLIESYWRTRHYDQMVIDRSRETIGRSRTVLAETADATRGDLTLYWSLRNAID